VDIGPKGPSGSQGEGADLTDTSPAEPLPELEHVRDEARRWVRRKRILYTILGVYGVLSLMWFAIDLADDSEGFWFYWPMFGTGIAVAVSAVVLLGVGGVFGTVWEQRQVDRYLERHRGTGRRDAGPRS
jgi:2TM domain